MTQLHPSAERAGAAGAADATVNTENLAAVAADATVKQVSRDPVEILHAALQAESAGLSVIPMKQDGSKAPVSERVSYDRLSQLLGPDVAREMCGEDGYDYTWKHRQFERATPDNIRQWFAPERGRTGMSIVHGRVSGGTEAIDVENNDVFQVICNTAEATGLDELLNRIRNGYEAATPKGRRLIYRCSQVSGNMKLAQRLGPPGPNGQPRTETLIEMRGEGGYSIEPPSHGGVHPSGEPYRLIRGGFESIVEITPVERERLHRLLRSFDDTPVREPEEIPTTRLAAGQGLLPGDDYNRRGDWRMLLEPHGAIFLGARGDREFLRRPGKPSHEPGHSAIVYTGHDGLRKLCVYSTNWYPFDFHQSGEKNAYSLFRAFALLEHGGDFNAAARDLARRGYGDQSSQVRVISSNGGGAAGADGTSGTDREPPAFSLSDTGNAERMVAQHGRDLRYCYPWVKWLIWDGHRWAPDDTAEVERRAKATIRSIATEAAAVAADDSAAFKALTTFALRSENVQRRRAMIQLAQSEEGIPVVPEDLDGDPMLFTCLNGTIDLRTGDTEPNDRRNLITKLSPVSYDPDATCPEFMAFLKQITNGRSGLMTFLQRALGYSLTGLTVERSIFILHGVGANGKSTLLEIARYILGDYAMRTPTETLLMKRDGGIPNDIARLKGARFVSASEAEEGRRLAESLIKEMTGGDTISARFMRGEFFDFKPEFKTWLATNHRPVIKGTDQGIWDRIKLVPFDVRIPEHHRDKHLLDKLRTEAPGILAWMVQGCLDWQRGGLGTPEEVRTATEGYRAEMDVLAAWIDDCCVTYPSAQATGKTLYHSYKVWADESGEKPLTNKAFSQRMAERGFTKTRGTGNGATAWSGIALKDPSVLKDPEGFSDITEMNTSSWGLSGKTLQNPSVDANPSVEEWQP